MVPEGAVMAAPAFDPREYEKAAQAQAAKAHAGLHTFDCERGTVGRQQRCLNMRAA